MLRVSTSLMRNVNMPGWSNRSESYYECMSLATSPSSCGQPALHARGLFNLLNKFFMSSLYKFQLHILQVLCIFKILSCSYKLYNIQSIQVHALHSTCFYMSVQYQFQLLYVSIHNPTSFTCLGYTSSCFYMSLNILQVLHTCLYTAVHSLY